MIFGKHINKYYLKYGPMLLLVPIIWQVPATCYGENCPSILSTRDFKTKLTLNL